MAQNEILSPMLTTAMELGNAAVSFFTSNQFRQDVTFCSNLGEFCLIFYIKLFC